MPNRWRRYNTPCYRNEGRGWPCCDHMGVPSIQSLF
ncbi:unnamed protein product [Spirodela intermedia]|uniref:Uncharacterized protein n=2 Tax=Spirodela intermedia TaxID=51605 RepID=A0A7I8JG23_SPIIN|nr:unnamed protein product [Spirodela intermedia]CAA6669118.1 unnamed protein product [Spirodela intermedia]CAA7406067.1 unnamed protein product [Spirodela intermedia]